MDVDLESLKLQRYEAEGCCDNGVRSFDSFKGKNAEFELV